MDGRFAAVLTRARLGGALFLALAGFALATERPFALLAGRLADLPAFRAGDFLAVFLGAFFAARLAGFPALRLFDRPDDLLAVFFFAFDDFDAIGLRDFFFAMRELL
ncbi:MAG: hypothetical protein WDO12_11305 [Pseudomonadota bacterium]